MGRRGGLVVGAVAYVAVHVYVVAGRSAREHDSWGYFVFSLLGHTKRLWGVPLLYWLVPGGDTAITAVQAVLAAAAWLGLAVVLRRHLRTPWIAWAASAWVLLLGLTRYVAEWNVMILSESLSVSLAVAVFAVAIEHRFAPASWTKWSFVGLLSWFAFTRQANLFVLIGIALVACIVVIRRSQASLRPVAGVLAALAVYAGLILATGNRDVARYNALWVTLNRTEQTASGRAHFAAAGFPDTPAVRAEYGNFRGSGSPLLHDRKVIVWVDDHFERTYAEYLLSHPTIAFVDPVRAAPDALTQNADNSTMRHVLPAPVSTVVFGANSLVVVLGAAAAFVVAVASVRRRRVPAGADVAVAAALIAVPMYFLAWYLAPGDLGRITLDSGLLLRMAAIAAIAFGLDSVFAPKVKPE